MTTRNLTNDYKNFRRRYFSNVPKKPLFGSRKSQSEDTVALVSDEDLEYGRHSLDDLPLELSPAWTRTVEEVEYGITLIQKRMKDLSDFHKNHLTRPSFNDSINDEHTIDITTQEITQLFHQYQRCIQSIQGNSHGAAKAEKTILRNVVSKLASQLQDLSQMFKKGQSTYLKKMKKREERGWEYFNSEYQPDNEYNIEDDNIDEYYDKGFTTAQLQMVEKNDKVVQQREEEISHVVRSIGDLNMIFKDLAVMIIDQGTILDRIDYNVEQASVEVERGLEQLQKGEKYQKSSRKMLCILALTVIVIIMIIVLAITKS